MKKSEQLKAIKNAYSELGMIGLQDGFFDVRNRLFDMNEAAERRHRRGAPNGITHGLGIKDAARLFTVSHLLDGFAEPDKWTTDAILHVRTEVLYAQAYAKKHHKELEPWAKKWTDIFAEVDYAELMKAAA
jgi:hypothetical protein